MLTRKNCCLIETPSPSRSQSPDYPLTVAVILRFLRQSGAPVWQSELRWFIICTFDSNENKCLCVLKQRKKDIDRNEFYLLFLSTFTWSSDGWRRECEAPRLAEGRLVRRCYRVTRTAEEVFFGLRQHAMCDGARRKENSAFFSPTPLQMYIR